MRILLISTAAALVATAVPASAQPALMASGQARQQQQQPAGQRDRDEADERQICMNVQLSNSRIARRVCRTEREWARSGELGGND